MLARYYCFSSCPGGQLIVSAAVETGSGESLSPPGSLAILGQEMGGSH